MTAGQGSVFGPGEGRRFWGGMSDATVKIASGTADFSVFETSLPPGVHEPPAHVHNSYDEAWYIIEGTVEFLLGERRVRQGAGSFVFVPRGLSHAFGNPGPDAARILIIGSSPVQQMVEESGRLAAEGNRSVQDILAELFQRFDSKLS